MVTRMGNLTVVGCAFCLMAALVSVLGLPNLAQSVCAITLSLIGLTLGEWYQRWQKLNPPQGNRPPSV